MAWSLHRVFAIHVALHDYERSSKLVEKSMVLEKTRYPNEHRVLCPLALSPDDVAEDADDAELPSTSAEKQPFSGPIVLPM